jgi:hypothetical protein
MRRIRWLLLISAIAIGVTLPTGASARTELGSSQWWWTKLHTQASIWATEAEDAYGNQPGELTLGYAYITNVRCFGIGRAWAPNGVPLYRKLSCHVRTESTHSGFGGFYSATIVPINRVYYRAYGW